MSNDDLRALGELLSRAILEEDGYVHWATADAHGRPYLTLDLSVHITDAEYELLGRVVEETSRCGECGGPLTNHECDDCGTLHNVGQAAMSVADDCVPGSSERYDGT